MLGVGRRVVLGRRGDRRSCARLESATVGLVLGFGAGALVASISFELAEQGFRVGGALPLSIGLALGAVVFYAADRAVNRMGGRPEQPAGLVLALGALLDGIPEQTVLGIGLAGGQQVSRRCWWRSSCPTCQRRSVRQAT